MHSTVHARVRVAHRVVCVCVCVSYQPFELLTNLLVFRLSAGFLSFDFFFGGVFKSSMSFF